MAFSFPRSIGMMLLAVWLILSGLPGITAFAAPAPVMSLLALAAGILLLVGR